MIEQDSKNQNFYPKDSVGSGKRIDFIEFSDDAITIWYSNVFYKEKTSFTILLKDVKNVYFEVSVWGFYRICRIIYKSGEKSKGIICGSYKESDLKQIKKIFSDKNIHVYGLPEIHMDLFRYSDDDKKGPIFSCGTKEGYLIGLRTFIIIMLIIWWVSSLVRKDPSYERDPVGIKVGILGFGIPAIGIILFLLFIIKDTHLGLTILDDGIIMRTYDFSHDHIERIKIKYSYIENITISQIFKNRYNVKIKTKGDEEYEIKNLKKGKKLEEELKQKGINNVNFISKAEEIVKIDPSSYI